MEIKERKNNIIAMVFLIVLSLFTYFYLIPSSIQEISAFSTEGSVSGRTFPQIMTIVICTIAVYELIKDIIVYRKLKKEQAEKGEIEEKTPFWQDKEKKLSVFRMVGLFLIVVIYAFLFVKVGLVIASVIALPACLFVLGSRNWKHYVAILVFTAVIFVLFRYVLDIIIPLFWFQI